MCSVFSLRSKVIFYEMQKLEFDEVSHLRKRFSNWILHPFTFYKNFLLWKNHHHRCPQQCCHDCGGKTCALRHRRFLDLQAYHPVCNLKENGLVATMRKVKTKIQTKYSVFLVKSREYQQVKFLQRIFCSWFVITLRAFFIRVSKNKNLTSSQLTNRN